MSQGAPGCMQQGGHVEVCHSQASVGPTIPSGLGRQTYTVKGKGSLAHQEDPSKQQAQLRRGLRATRLLDRDDEETRGRGQLC